MADFGPVAVERPARIERRLGYHEDAPDAEKWGATLRHHRREPEGTGGDDRLGASISRVTPGFFSSSAHHRHPLLPAQRSHLLGEEPGAALVRVQENGTSRRPPVGQDQAGDATSRTEVQESRRLASELPLDHSGEAERMGDLRLDGTVPEIAQLPGTLQGGPYSRGNPGARLSRRRRTPQRRRWGRSRCSGGGPPLQSGSPPRPSR